MSGIRLKGTGSALPRQVVTNRDLQRIVETDDAWIVSRTGIRERRKCRAETQSSLAEAAARAAMEMAGIGPETVGVCLVPTITADYITPSTACVLQNRLGLPEDTVCFDLNTAPHAHGAGGPGNLGDSQRAGDQPGSRAGAVYGGNGGVPVCRGDRTPVHGSGAGPGWAGVGGRG